MLSTFEKIDNTEGKIEILFKPDISQDTLKYINSEQLEDVEYPDSQYPNDFLNQFNEFNPDSSSIKMKHRYTV